MPTFTIVSSSKAPLGPGEINAGTSILVNDGDVFIIDPAADQNITFEAAGGTPANFDVQVNASNSNSFEVVFETNLTPSVTVADNVDASGVAIMGSNADAINFTAGDNVTFGTYNGSTSGVDDITVGNDFTAADNWQTLGGADVVRIGDDASFLDLQTGDGNDTVFVGTNATFTKLDGEGGADTLNTQSTGLGEESFESVHNVCYAAGTLIDTPAGPRRIETLHRGDKVYTLENGNQSILWIHHSFQAFDDFDPYAKPILISAGALGGMRPKHDLIVSPQHRILVGEHRQLQDRFEVAALVPAKSLTCLPGIRSMPSKRRVLWIHFACARHEIVSANGCFSESLLLGPMVVNGLTRPERLTLTEIYGRPPSPEKAINGPPARTCLGAGVVQRMLKEDNRVSV